MGAKLPRNDFLAARPLVAAEPEAFFGGMVVTVVKVFPCFSLQGAMTVIDMIGELPLGFCDGHFCHGEATANVGRRKTCNCRIYNGIYLL